MSTTVMSATESPPVTAKLITEATEVEFVKCDCCGLTEECTPEYIERIRERYLRKWICGLCGEAVKDEIVRSERLISTEEAMARHVSFCRTAISLGSPPDLTVHLIATVRQILRRCSPTTKSSDCAGVTRSESWIPNLTLIVDSSPAAEDNE